MTGTVDRMLARTGLSPVMVGRDAELERLRRLLQPTGDPRVALVSGEAGVGKTRLVQELLASAPPSTVVLSGRAEQGAMGRPYQLLLEAVEPIVSQWQAVPDELAGRRDSLCLLLSPVAPLLDTCPDRHYEPEELGRAGVELLRHLAGAGAVIVFEDLHWADAESLTFFGRLATTPGLPILLVGTFRPEDLDRRHVTDLLASVERQVSVEHATVHRLSMDEVADLLAAVYGRPVPPPVAESLHRRTGGNPFFVEELLVSSGDAPPEELGSLALPVSLGEAVIRHLDGLHPEERRAVDAAAVLGHRIPFDLLAAVTGLGEDDLIVVLRDLVARGLLVEEDTDVFSFRHALTREAVANRLLGRERRRLHEKALVAMQELGSDDWAALTHHAAGANRWDEMVGAARTGAAHYLRTGSTFQALRLAEMGLDEADADLELLELAARAAWSVGLRDSAVDRTEQWRRLAEAVGDERQACRALLLLARLRWEAGDGEAQLRTVEKAVALAERLGPSEELAWAYNGLAEAAMLRYDTERAVALADRALELARTVGSAPAEAAILVNRGSAIISRPGGFEEGAELLLEGADAAEKVGDHLSVLRALNNLADGAFLRWPGERSHWLVRRMIEVVDRAGRRDWLPQRYAHEAVLLAHIDGDLAAARAAVAHSRGEPVMSCAYDAPWTFLLDADLALEAGDLDTAAERLADAGERARRREYLSEDNAWLDAAQAELAASRGDAAGALEYLRATTARMRADDKAWLLTPEVWHRAARAALRAGVSPADIRTEQATLPSPPADAVSGEPAWRPHLEGALLEAEGDAAGALGAYDAALADCSRNRPVKDVADAPLGRARSLLAAGRNEEARASAQTARALLDRWPGWRRDDADALLRRLGAAAAVDGPVALTPREREVAALVAEGLSNGEIASRLYISAKTASVHVSNILTKLGMSSRTEIATWAVREGLGA